MSYVIIKSSSCQTCKAGIRAPFSPMRTQKLNDSPRSRTHGSPSSGQEPYRSNQGARQGPLLNPRLLLRWGSLSPASRLQSEHHLYQLDASLAGLEQPGGGTEGSAPACLGAVPAGGSWASRWFLLSRTWHQPLLFDSFYFKLSLFSLLGWGAGLRSGVE